VFCVGREARTTPTTLTFTSILEDAQTRQVPARLAILKSALDTGLAAGIRRKPCRVSIILRRSVALSSTLATRLELR